MVINKLWYIQKKKKKRKKKVMVCSGCEEAVVDTCYTCDKCNFHLHKKCAELPTQINHHLHPQHPLFAKPPLHFTGSCRCDLCYKICKSFVYYCYLCKFGLDIKCALPPCIFEPQAQHHQFIRLGKPILLKSSAFTCNACGTDGNQNPYLCHMCGILIHEHCSSLRRIVNSPFHPHPITHTYLLKENKSWNPYCGICQIEVKTEYGCYNCPECNFIVHVNCANAYESKSDDKEELEKLSTTAVDGFVEPTAIIVRQIQLEDEDKMVAAEIKHFSHQHNLILIQDNNSNHDDQICDGCMLPINPPFYGCSECNFFLDESCIKLPKRQTLLHHSQKVRMTLLSKSTASVDGIFQCWFCEKYCNGFVYNLDDDPTNTIQSDVRCVKSVFNSIKHEGHEHPLFYAQRKDYYHCSACHSKCCDFFTCASCNFILDIKCATLPYKQRHRFDNHPLFLTYDPIDDGSDEYYCDICEMRRDPKFWVYYCKQCDFAAHPDCINKNPFVKLGGAFTYDIHPHHPLTLVQKSSSRKYPPCHSCGKPCDDLALECTVSGYKFIVHRKKYDECCFRPATRRLVKSLSKFKLRRRRWLIISRGGRIRSVIYNMRRGT